MSNLSYFLHDGHTQTGPFSMAELEQQPVTNQTMVWREGLPDWLPVQQVPELSHVVPPAAPPPFTPKSLHVPSQTAPAPHPAKRISKATWMIAGLVVSVLLVAGLIAYTSQHRGGNPTPEPAPDASAQLEAERAERNQAQQDAEHARDVKRQVASNIQRYVTATVTYESNRFFGGISDVQVTVTNTSPYTVDEAVIELTYVKKNGEVYETETVTAYNIFPRASVAVAGGGCSRGTTMQCTMRRARLQ